MLKYILVNAKVHFSVLPTQFAILEWDHCYMSKTRPQIFLLVLKFCEPSLITSNLLSERKSVTMFWLLDFLEVNNKISSTEEWRKKSMFMKYLIKEGMLVRVSPHCKA